MQTRDESRIIAALNQLAIDEQMEFRKQPSAYKLKTSTDYPGVNQFSREDKKSGRKYEIWVDTRYNTVSYILHGNDADKKSGLVGTDGRAVVKHFNKDSYDYLKVDDFIDRAQLVFNAAKKMLTTPPEKATENKKLLEAIEVYRVNVMKEISEKCNFHGIRDNVRESSEVYDEKITVASTIVKQTIKNLAAGIAAEKWPGNSTKAEELVDALRQAEIDFTREHGRPVVVKSANIKGQERISVQIPLGEKTIPSSDRTGVHSTKLSNHVRDVSGRIDANGKVQIEVVVDGHSSYPPIGYSPSSKFGKDETELMRRYIAYQSVEEKIAQIASDKLKAGQQEPITISLSTMMMLTPLFGKAIESKARGKESEHGQLADTSYALEILRHKDQPFEIMVGGKVVKVKLDLTYMNMPVNVGKKTQLITKSKLQNDINSASFIQFNRQMYTSLNNSNIHLPALNKYFDLYTSAIDKVHKDNDRDEKQLNYLYENLRSTMETFKENPSKEAIKNYDYCCEEIATVEDRIGKRYKDAKKIQKDIYKKNRSLRDDAISELVTSLKSENDPGKRDFILSQLHYLQAEKLYYSGQYRELKNAYHFHVNYLLANAGIGRNIEAFCKSAEDRTGWLRVLLQAFVTFKSVNNSLPNLEDAKERELFYKDYVNPAFELSASLENTRENSMARSLQVSQAITNPGYNMDSGKKMSTMAKTVFKELPPANNDFTRIMNPEMSAQAPLRQQGRIMRLLTRTAPRISISKKRPSVEKKQTAPDTNTLITPAKIDDIKKYITENNIKAPARISKNKLGEDCPFSVMLVPQDKEPGYRLLAIFKGEKSNMHIGKGSFGVVKLYQDLDTTEFIVGKLMTNQTESEMKSQQHETDMLKKTGQYIGEVPYARTRQDAYGDPQQQKVNVILMHLAPGKPPSREWIKTGMEKLQDPLLPLQAMLAAMEAVNHLHQQGIVHLDIKLANMHFDPETKKMTLIDFGTSLELDASGTTSAKLRGTPSLMDPQDYAKFLEIIQQQRNNKMDPQTNVDVPISYSPKTDIYCLGMAFANMLGMAENLKDKNGFNRITLLPLSKISNSLIKDKGVIEEMYTLLSNMTAANPKDRISLDDGIKQLKDIMKRMQPVTAEEKTTPSPMR